MIRAALLCFALLLAACAPPQTPGVRVLTYSSPYAPSHPFSRADQRWMKFIEQRSGGRIKIKPYWSGVLLSSDQSIQEIRHGVADIGLITPIYARGGAHLVRAQSGFYGGVRTIEGQVGVYKCLAREFPALRAELSGLHVLAIQGGNFPGVLTRSKPVHSLKDLEGLRLRAPSELTNVLRGLGADPVDMPMGEVYSALSKNVIDGVVAPTDALKSLHFGEIAKYYSTLHVSRGAYPARAMAQKTWDSLPPDLQGVLDEGALVWEAALAEELGKAEISGEKYGHETGIVFAPFPAADQEKFDAMYNATAQSEARKLKAIGIDAEPVFHHAQVLIALGDTALATCPKGAS